MRNLAVAALAATWVVWLGGCTHLSTEDRYRSKAQVLRLTECEKLEALRLFEIGLFQAGFIRTVVREEEPIPFELVDGLVSVNPRLIEYLKSDFTATKTRGSEPYVEVRNRYKIAACEEPGGALYLVVVRHDPEPGDQFLGTRLSAALKTSGCVVAPAAAPREIGFYKDSTEEDILRHIKRGRCQDYALAR